MPSLLTLFGQPEIVLCYICPVLLEKPTQMPELPKGRIEIPRGKRMYQLWLTPEIHAVLKFYAQDEDTSITDAGNRILLGFLTKVYGFESHAELRRRTLKDIFPNQRAVYDALVSIAHGKKPRRRPLPLRRKGILPFSSAESTSSEQDNP